MNEYKVIAFIGPNPDRGYSRHSYIHTIEDMSGKQFNIDIMSDILNYVGSNSPSSSDEDEWDIWEEEMCNNLVGKSIVINMIEYHLPKSSSGGIIKS